MIPIENVIHPGWYGISLSVVQEPVWLELASEDSWSLARAGE